MQIADISMCEFISASTAGIVNVMLGHEPDFWLFIQNHGGTNPNIYIGAKNAAALGWAAALSLLITGSTGVVTRTTSGITIFSGGTPISTAETDNSDPKHVDSAGACITVFPTITQGGLSIPAALQTNSGRNLLVAFRRNR